MEYENITDKIIYLIFFAQSILFHHWENYAIGLHTVVEMRGGRGGGG